MSFMLVLIINVYDGAILIFNSDLISALIAIDCDVMLAFIFQIKARDGGKNCWTLSCFSYLFILPQ